MPEEKSKNSPPLTVVCEGEILETNLRRCGKDSRWIQKMAGEQHLKTEDIYLMMAGQDGSYEIIPKEQQK